MSFKTARDKIFSLIDYHPTDIQKAIHESEARIKLVTGGWRSGKSFLGAKEALLYAPISELIWLLAPTYDFPREAEYKYLADDLSKLKMTKKVSLAEQGSLTIETHNGCRIVTRSATDPMKIASEAPDFILMIEAAQMSYEIFMRVLGRASQKNAPIVLTGTLEEAEGTRWYEELYTKWQAVNDLNAKSFSLPTWSNIYDYPPGDKEIVLKGGKVLKNVNEKLFEIWQEELPDKFLLRYAAIPCPLEGLILPEFSVTTHVGDYPFDPDLPVDICVDPGYAGAYAVLAMQSKGDTDYLIDEVYLQGYVTEDIITICKQKPWWSKVQEGTIDIAGKQHQAMAAPIEIWQKSGLYLTSKQVEVEDGIDLLRTRLKINPIINKPKLYIDYKCRGFIAESGGGKSPVSGGGAYLRDKNTGKVLDKNNHAIKAVIYRLAFKYGYTPRIMKYEPVHSLHFAGRR